MVTETDVTSSCAGRRARFSFRPRHGATKLRFGALSPMRKTRDPRGGGEKGRGLGLVATAVIEVGVNAERGVSRHRLLLLYRVYLIGFALGGEITSQKKEDSWILENKQT